MYGLFQLQPCTLYNIGCYTLYIMYTNVYYTLHFVHTPTWPLHFDPCDNEDANRSDGATIKVPLHDKTLGGGGGQR